MGRFRILAASAIFLLITLLKLASPVLAAEIRRGLLPELDRQTDYRSVVETLGRSISRRNDAMIYALRENTGAGQSAPTHAAVTETPGTVPENDDPVPANTAEPVAEAEPLPAMSSPVENDAETTAADEITAQAEHSASPAAEEAASVTSGGAPDEPAAVAAFMKTLEAYPDQSLPANVSSGMPEIPFEYAVPVSGANSSGFGFRVHPVYGDVRFHYGTDFAAGSGEDICAFAGGTVVLAGEYGSYGQCVVISHADGWQTLYGHCSKLCVTNGEQVEAGERIALVGQTGNATGPHLHFELTRDAVYYNPEYYIA